MINNIKQCFKILNHRIHSMYLDRSLYNIYTVGTRYMFTLIVVSYKLNQAN